MFKEKLLTSVVSVIEITDLIACHHMPDANLITLPVWRRGVKGFGISFNPTPAGPAYA